MNKIYLDHAATTPVFPEVVKKMADLMTNHYGNPSSLHSSGREAKNYLEEARHHVADLMGAEDGEIFFTSGGTEADNLAILGSAARFPQGGHVVTSAVEHHAVLDTCTYLRKKGFDVTVLPVDKYGMVGAEEVKNALRKDTVLVSIMHANNEVGTINPIAEISKAVKENCGALFHVDAVQSYGKIDTDVNQLGVDLMSVSSHKINGPKGVGALYKRKGVILERVVHGGGQEKKLRSGTENLPGIVAMGLAAQLTKVRMPEDPMKWQAMRDRLIERILNEVPHSRLNGHPVMRLPQNTNFSFNFIEAEALLLHLDLLGIECSIGSACGAGEASHVLKAMGLEGMWLHSSLRLTIGFGNNMEQIEYVADKVKEKVELLRQASPYYDSKTGGSSGLKPLD